MVWDGLGNLAGGCLPVGRRKLGKVQRCILFVHGESGTFCLGVDKDRTLEGKDICGDLDSTVVGLARFEGEGGERLRYYV